MSDRKYFDNIVRLWETYGKLDDVEISWLIDKLEEYLPEELE